MPSSTLGPGTSTHKDRHMAVFVYVYATLLLSPPLYPHMFLRVCIVRHDSIPHPSVHIWSYSIILCEVTILRHRYPCTRTQGLIGALFMLYYSSSVAGIVYRYYGSLPRTRKGFDSPYPLRNHSPTFAVGYVFLASFYAYFRPFLGLDFSVWTCYTVCTIQCVIRGSNKWLSRPFFVSPFRH